MRFHYQNLNENSRGEPKGTILKHGRAWLNIGRFAFHWEWVFGKLRLGIGVDTNVHDDDLMFHVSVPGFSFYFAVAGVFPRRWKTHDLGRHTGIRVFDWGIWFDIWTDGNRWSRSLPWYAKTICIHPLDVIFGRQAYSDRPVEERELSVAMPEANYPVRIEIKECIWKRPRSPFKLKILRAYVTPMKPVPVPGKGENSWDCDEDAIHSSVFPCETIGDALTKFTADLLKTRHRYGGFNWKPEQVKP